jgi:molybdate transport system substrate-binding protein
MNDLDILSAGAAKGLVHALQQPFLEQGGVGLHGVFSAVGAIRDELMRGAPCDVLILTSKMLDELAQSGHVEAASCTPLGSVRTGIAVRRGATRPDVTTPDALRTALLAASAVYIPDPERATAGIHFANVLRQLDIHLQLASRLRAYPNGAAAMQALAREGAHDALGCTQITEILYTPGIALVDSLPEALGLTTVYSAAVATRARQPELAQRFVAFLSGPQAQTQREAGGFEALLTNS